MHLDDIAIRPARADEARVLSTLAYRSKAYWGYSSEFMAACREELTYSPDTIDEARFEFFVADAGGEVIGFYALERLSSETVELEALFVEPAYIGHGVGRALIEHAEQRAVDAGARSMIIQGDPNALAFYQAAGGIVIGERESASIPGRYLPLLEVKLDTPTGCCPTECATRSQ